jgi:hypothetical protein
MRLFRHGRTSRESDAGAPTPGPSRVPRWALWTALVVVLAGTLTAVALSSGSSGTSQQQPTPAPGATSGTGGTPATGGKPATSGPVAPKTGALVGSWVKPEGGSGGDVTAAVDTLQKGINRRLDIVHVYRKWNEPFPADTELAAIRQGSTPMISWAGANTEQIAAGTYDGLIRQRAQAIRDLRVPVLLRWFWEMDRPAQAGKTVSGPDYIAAWRHIRAVFRQEGATNAGWVWCPTATGFAQNRVDAYYPGDSQVDWLCADGYTGNTAGGWRSFQEVFQPFYDWARPHPQPLMIGEFGVPEGAPGQRAAWLRAAGQTLKSTFPRIKAVVYFDAVRIDNGGQQNIWTLRGYPDALAAFSALARDPYFNTRRLPALG